MNLSAISQNKVTQALKKHIDDDNLLNYYVKIVGNRWLPRSIKCAATYLHKKLNNFKGGFYFYGLGSHTQALLKEPIMEQHCQRIMGGFDKRAIEIVQRYHYKFPIYSLGQLENTLKAPIVLSHHEFEDNMRQVLLSYGVEGSRIISIYDDPLYEEISTFFYQNSINIVQRIEKKKHRVAIVSARSTAIFPLESWVDLFPDHEIVHLDLGRESSPKCHHLSYLSCQQSIKFLLAAIYELQPKLIYVHDQFITGNILAFLIKAVFPQFKLVLELYDILQIYFDDITAMTRHWYWNMNDLKLALFAETKGMLKYDGVVHKEECTAVDELYKNNSTPLLCFKPYVYSADLCNKEKVAVDSPCKLVWAGGIIASSVSTELFGDGQILPIVKLLISKNFQITLITGHKTYEQFKIDFPDYAQEIDQSSHLFFRSGQSRSHLIHWMASEYSYGLLLNNITKNSVRELGLKTTFAAKLITYLSAGLPVIISREMSYMANWVEQCGIGIVISADELSDIDAIINCTDYIRLKQQVKKIQQKIALEHNISEFSAFIYSIVEQKNVSLLATSGVIKANL